ncbi:signal peptid-containing protein [Lutibaculum baratangense]|uniref:Putative signal peptid-containing protein n=1 Tax=Lutibaculum baratangense AMV1 TaxID=631454 RepID=V4RF81_9HYPH|nr:signal peptid-containing protein [Lutibaculum baratangense]ESR24024.1 putative signal peptid-containing protein [Lutibaculum baratangense AMV1]
MKHVLAVAVTLAFATPAFASQCPSLMSEIDEKVDTAQLTEEERAQVMELRQQGEAAHEAGDHAASEEALNQALAILAE